MLTQCPACNTLFRVTAAILKMGHGQVRCGKCRTQFDALESLLDEEEPSAPTPAPANKSVAESVAERIATSPPQGIGEEITLEGSNIEITGTYAPISEDEVSDAREEPFVAERYTSDDSLAAEPDAEIEIEFANDDTGELRSDFVGDESDGDLSTEEDELIESSVDAPDSQTAATETQSSDLDTADAPGMRVDTHAAGDQRPPISQRIWRRHHGLHTKRRHEERQAIAAELDALTVDSSSPNRTRLWATASVALILVLAAQVVNHYRDTLVRNSKFGPTVTRLYHALGLTLTPHWELKDYELQQWGVIADPAAPNTLRVRASVTNRAPFAQPYPLIRLALQDRWGSPVAMRTFTPSEYLPEKNAADRLLSPKQRANAEIVIVDPGNDAVSFQIHACLRDERGLSCSDG